MRKGIRLCLQFALLLCLLFSVACADEEAEVYLSDSQAMPYLYLRAPLPNTSFDSGNQLHVHVEAQNAEAIEVELRLAEETLTFFSVGSECEHVFVWNTPQTQSATLVLLGYSNKEADASARVTEKRVVILSPKAELIEKMIALAYRNSKDNRYKFARAQDDWDIGVCKNYVMRLFDTYSKAYRMLAYPQLPLHMPKNNSKVACAPYDYGIEWRPETAGDGSPFEIAAQFKYDDSLSKQENAELARNLLVQIRKGDFLQIVGYYGGGNGPHSLYIIEDYDPVTKMLHWTDSNMRGTRVDGARWGYLQYDADADVEWWIEVFNRRKRGATLYRLRDDLYKP